MNTTPVKIVETVLRDGHQSLAATRMRISDMVPILEELDDMGYYALEAWGGATFDACLRFLGEDPWERLRILKKHLKKTPIQMLLRGQNILGYSHYADDVVQEFVKRSVDNGVSIIRIPRREGRFGEGVWAERQYPHRSEGAYLPDTGRYAVEPAEPDEGNGLG